MSRVAVRITSLSESLGHATVSIAVSENPRLEKVQFSYDSMMTAGQMEIAALKAMKKEYEQYLALINSGISNREARQP